MQSESDAQTKRLGRKQIDTRILCCSCRDVAKGREAISLMRWREHRDDAHFEGHIVEELEGESG